MGGDLENGAGPGRVAEVPRVAVRPGYSVSRIIKGGWQLSGGHGAVNADQAISDMVRFVDAGVTAFDCADIYSGVEDKIGRFRAGLLRARGQEALDRLKVHTKYVPDRDSLARLAPRDVEAGIDRSLMRLGMDRLDLVQFHWWDYAVPGHVDAVGHLGTLRDKGKIDLIGVTNFDAEHLAELCDWTDVASAQVQYSLLDRRASGEFAALARGRGVSLFAYGVLAGGFLADAWLGRPDPGFDFENRSLVKYRLIIEEFGGWALFQDLLAALRAVADRHGADIAAIALRATLDSPDVAATIVGARYADRLPQTFRAIEIELTDRDRREIEAVRDRSTGPLGSVYGLERDVTGRHGRIMKYNLNKGDDRMAGTARQGEVA
ncbi:MAG: aldo/keto reductase [Boseongicola sp. SB0673_bin_14]|nr:aldo/keto reductase [Boseongicola sp. SB0673_bin_14]